jgi:hypothetical protein
LLLIGWTTGVPKGASRSMTPPSQAFFNSSRVCRHFSHFLREMK